MSFKKKEMHTNQKCAVPQIFTHTNTHNRAGVGDGGVEPALRSKSEHEQHPGIPHPGTTTPRVTSMLTFNSRGSSACFLSSLWMEPYTMWSPVTGFFRSTLQVTLIHPLQMVVALFAVHHRGCPTANLDAHLWAGTYNLCLWCLYFCFFLVTERFF